MCSKLIVAVLVCAGCNTCADRTPPFEEQIINGRDELICYGQMARRPVYQAKVPLAWTRIDPKAKEPLLDTTKPIVTFAIDEHVLLAVHSFPTNSLEERIPVAAQIERWRSQFKAEKYQIEPTGHSGFSGLYLEGENLQTTLCAWAMQLDLEHYQTLHFIAGTVEEEEHYKQMASDFTIKVAGPTDLIEKHRDEIHLFANSFELIQEIPQR